MCGFRYLCGENEATFWFHNFLQDKGFDSCTANIFIYHPVLEVGVIHSQADEWGFFTNDQWRNDSLWCLGWNQSKSLEASAAHVNTGLPRQEKPAEKNIECRDTLAQRTS